MANLQEGYHANISYKVKKITPAMHSRNDPRFDIASLPLAGPAIKNPVRANLAMYGNSIDVEVRHQESRGGNFVIFESKAAYQSFLSANDLRVDSLVAFCGICTDNAWTLHFYRINSAGEMILNPSTGQSVPVPGIPPQKVQEIAQKGTRAVSARRNVPNRAAPAPPRPSGVTKTTAPKTAVKTRSSSIFNKAAPSAAGPSNAVPMLTAAHDNMMVADNQIALNASLATAHSQPARGTKRSRDALDDENSNEAGPSAAAAAAAPVGPGTFTRGFVPQPTRHQPTRNVKNPRLSDEMVGILTGKNDDIGEEMVPAKRSRSSGEYSGPILDILCQAAQHVEEQAASPSASAASAGALDAVFAWTPAPVPALSVSTYGAATAVAAEVLSALSDTASSPPASASAGGDSDVEMEDAEEMDDLTASLDAPSTGFWCFMQ